MLTYEEYVSLQVKLQLDNEKLTKEEFSKLMKHNYEVQKSQVEGVKKLEEIRKQEEITSQHLVTNNSHLDEIHTKIDIGFYETQQEISKTFTGTLEPSRVELVKGKPIETDKAILFVLIAGFALIGCVWLSKSLLGWGLGDY